MARRLQRLKLAPGVWRDKAGISVVVRTRYEYVEERFPLGTDLTKLKHRRDALRVLLRDRAKVKKAKQQGYPRARGKATLADDVPVYLKARAAMATIEERELQLSRWVKVFGRRERHKIASHEIQAQRDAWVNAGKSASWVNHHLRALSNLYRVLDPDGPNPMAREEPRDAAPWRPTPRRRAFPIPRRSCRRQARRRSGGPTAGSLRAQPLLC